MPWFHQRWRLWVNPVNSFWTETITTINQTKAKTKPFAYRINWTDATQFLTNNTPLGAKRRLRFTITDCYNLFWNGLAITSTQVAADRGALRIWRWVSLSEGWQKFWLQWQLADYAWLACARVAICHWATKQRTNTVPLSEQRSHPHLNSIFASKLHARDPLHWVICIRLIYWHGAHLQAVVIVMKIILPGPEKLPLSLWSRNLRVLPKLMSGRVIAYAGDFKFYHNILYFFCGSVQFYLKNKKNKNKKRELNSNMHNGFKLSKKSHQFSVVLIRLRTWWHQYGILKESPVGSCPAIEISLAYQIQIQHKAVGW